MGYKEIMSQVDKQKSVAFMLNFKVRWNGRPETFSQAVSDSLKSIGIDVFVGSSTADAVITRMERKSKISMI